MNDTATNHSNRFMADLTQAMRSTAETARTATVETARADAKAYVEWLRTEEEAEGLRKDAEADVAEIRERSKARVERVRRETEQRIARRREFLDQELQEYNSAIELEISSVDERVAAFKEEVGRFFEQLLQGADPTVFATMASQMPDPPSFNELDRRALANELRARREQAERPAQAQGATPAAPQEAAPADGGNGGKPNQLPDHWWLDSPSARASGAQSEESR